MDNGQAICDQWNSDPHKKPRKPNCDLCNNWPRIVRTWSTTSIFSFLCSLVLCFQLRTNQRKLNMLCKPVAQDAPLLVKPPPVSLCQWPWLRVYIKPFPQLPFFCYKGFPLPWEPLSICQMQADGWLPCYSKLEQSVHNRVVSVYLCLPPLFFVPLFPFLLSLEHILPCPLWVINIHLLNISLGITSDNSNNNSYY